MTNFKSYVYYSKHDSKKESIDKVKVATEEDAIVYFAGRKKMDIETFNKLYTVHESK
jgi:hypothetical protein